MTMTAHRPTIIQGGMGVAVSGWQLARAVAATGQLGVVSGTALDTVFARRLQDGDAGGDLRRAMRHFPIPGVADSVLGLYYRPNGRDPGQAYKLLPMYKQKVSVARQRVTMLANFVEVFLAKEGHTGPVGINLLTKVQMPNLASLYGAMLAGVDYVLMGAGIPREIPGALDALAEHRTACMRFDIDGAAPGEVESLTFEPAHHWTDRPVPPPLKRPQFLAIVSANSLATTLARKANGRVDGFVVEGPTAGGHNAPPRGEMQLNERGEPLYGERDTVDLSRLAELGLPFWLAGGAGSPGALREALESGAAGVQVGTLFAFADESGVTEQLKRDVIAYAQRGEVDVLTDPRASPTGYPFKVVRWATDGTGYPFKVVRWATDGPELPPRTRNCDLGYLRVAYRRPDGRLGYRCSAEPVEDYVAKGGRIEDTEGRKCLCNALLANVGHPQTRDDGREEPPVLTSGDDLRTITGFLGTRTRYTAADVIDHLLGQTDSSLLHAGLHG